MLSAADTGAVGTLAQQRGFSHRDKSPVDAESAAIHMMASGLAAGNIAVAVVQTGAGDPAILYVNDAFLRMTGHRRADVVGQPCSFLDGPDTSPCTSLELDRALRDNRPFDQELLHYRSDGTPFWNSVTLTPLRDGDDAPPRKGHHMRDGSLIIMRDVSQRRRADQQLAARADRLYEMAMSDQLTGIANRRSFDAALEREWQRASRDGSHLALALLDIDHFKIYNDRFGHPMGDDCLQAVARLLGGVLRHHTDLLARYGGEEFAVLLPDTQADGAAKVAQRLTDAVHEAAIAHPGCRGGRLTISGGILSVQPVLFTGGVRRFVVLADRALYAAKSAGRDRVHRASAD